MPIDPFYGLPVNDSAILGFWGSARTSVQGIPRGSCSWVCNWAALHNRSAPPALLCDVTATVDWCEENYVHTPFIAELWNTASSVPMVLAGLWGLYKARLSVASVVCASME
jgi:hypothetical protein